MLLKIILSLILSALEKFGPDILEAVKTFIEGLQKKPSREERKALKRECVGVACKTEIKK